MPLKFVRELNLKWRNFVETKNIFNTIIYPIEVLQWAHLLL
jgi:hypothetical protein